MKVPLHIPFAVGLIDPTGRDIPLRLEGEAAPVGTTRVLDVRARAAVIPLRRHRRREPVPSLLRGFSAPVTVEFEYADAELAFLAAHDSDAVNRWDAAQRSFAMPCWRSRAINATARHWRSRRRCAGSSANCWRTASAIRRCWRWRLTPPDPAYVAALAPVIDVDGVVAARDFLVRELGRGLRREFERIYHAAPRARTLCADAGPDRIAQARQHVPALPGRRRTTQPRARLQSRISMPPTT